MSKDYYGVLGISQTANIDEIKKAYKDQARKWHPDRNMNNATEAKERFQAINEAFETLSDQNKRMLYDMTSGQGSRPIPNNYTHPFSSTGGFFRSTNDPSRQYPSYRYSGNSTYNDNNNGTDNFSSNSYNPFTDFLSNARRSRFQQQQQQQQQSRFSQPYHRPDFRWMPPQAGPEQNISRRRARHSPRDPRTANGSSNPSTTSTAFPSTTATPSSTTAPRPPPPPPPSSSTTAPTPAPTPSSSIPTPTPAPSSSIPTATPSSSTKPKNPPPPPIKKPLPTTLEELYTGTTKRLKVTRKTRQATKTEKILTVEIRAGTKSGTKIVFPEEGDETEDGTQDIEFIVEELQHQSYARHDDSLQVTVNLTLTEALTGFNKEIPALDKTMIPLTSNTTIQPGQRIRLNRRGMPNVETGRKGDLVVTYNVILPPSLTETQKQIISDTLGGSTQ